MRWDDSDAVATRAVKRVVIHVQVGGGAGFSPHVDFDVWNYAVIHNVVEDVHGGRHV